MRLTFLMRVFSAVALVVLSADVSHAQRGHHHGGHGGVTVIPVSPLLWGGGFYAGYHPFYVGFGPWYPFPAFGFPPGVYAQDHVVTVRLQVSPREAQVFVDGFAAGIVDDYDGVFQRLRLIPGPHEIVIYQPGYRTLRRHVYFNPGSNHTVRETLERLMPGEAPEPPPMPRPMPAHPGMPGPVPPSGTGAGVAFDPSRTGTLALRIQPADATILVDGESWKGPQPQERLVIHLREGSHRVRVEKPGFQPFSVDVDVRAGETASFNVSLLSQ